MAATEYDQIDNDYKPVPSAKQIEEKREEERIEDMEYEQKQEQYRAKRNEALQRQEELREAKRRQDEKEDQEEKQELYRRKRQEAIERQDEMRERAKEEKTKKFAQEEEYRKKVIDSNKEWDEFLKKGQTINRPHGPDQPQSTMPTFGQMLFSKIQKAPSKLGDFVYSGTKKHVEASYNDLVKVPFQRKPEKGEKPQYTRSQKPTFIPKILGAGSKQFQGMGGGGLLSSATAYRPRQSFLLFSQPPAPRRKPKKSGTRKTSSRATRSNKRDFLDDMLFF